MENFKLALAIYISKTVMLRIPIWSKHWCEKEDIKTFARHLNTKQIGWLEINLEIHVTILRLAIKERFH